MQEETLASLISLGYLKGKRTISAMRKIPRELFLPADLRAAAWDDMPLPMASGRPYRRPTCMLSCWRPHKYGKATKSSR